MKTDSVVRFLSLDMLDSDKPLIREYFRHAHHVAIQKLLKHRALSRTLFEIPSLSSQSGISESNFTAERDELSADNNAAFPASDAPARLKLFVLSPSVSEPQRYCQKGVLSETESLQAKHALEYEFLIPAISYAVESVIEAHKMWKQRLDKQKEDHQKNSEAEGETTAPSIESAAAVAPNGHTNGLGEVLDAEVTRESFNVFDTSTAPSISFSGYVNRIVEYTYVSPSVLLIACLYIDRLLSRKPSLFLTKLNIFKLFASATRVASKVMDTRTLSNKNFASICGVRNSEMNCLEAHFIRFLELDLYVQAEEFYRYVDDLVTTPRSRRPSTKSEVLSAGEFDEEDALMLPVLRRLSMASGNSSGGSRMSRGGEEKKSDLFPPFLPSRVSIASANSQAFTPPKGLTSAAVKSNDYASEVGKKTKKGDSVAVAGNGVVPVIRVENEEKCFSGPFFSRSTTAATMSMPALPRRASRLPVCSNKSISNISIGSNNMSVSRSFETSAARQHRERA
ncbi:hypothetical protein C3747_11g79 [Trypanosoma cruzi]|uniref:Cyclin n=2 Tax=Trypanosoma cruzi TaxID=5693 RepID=Q4D4J7_TRYCC|nr:hypothetical protein, conserved [Trypanosoma cruzi]EAN87457.1 hypothetical protein, conserved [Trypanosoma cruzi]PWV18974.1 hypothetical protein C3747_11g79 [Trypanosoma cruzi]RNC59430.1 cyclin-dependent protein kinase [Trypanosoma cruzi]|eukprot:XP_809308.1 hypothetical protein [Trypanosoma cruzi strain CL Brener]